MLQLAELCGVCRVQASLQNGFVFCLTAYLPDFMEDLDFPADWTNCGIGLK
jgi:hypothetical protein